MNIIKKIISFIKTNRWLLFGILLLIILAYFYHNKIFSIHFVDEEDNFVLGKFLLENQKLYSDLFSHHQPLGYIMSAGLQFIVDISNIFMLIKRHREFMILWSLIWSILLLFRYREKVLIPLLIYELTKFYLLGDLFLSESLAVYPMLYLFLQLFQTGKKIAKFELFIIGMMFAFVAFMLAPAWPLLFAYLLVLIWIRKLKIFENLYFIAGGLFILLLCIPFVDIYYYFYNVFYINFTYYIPLGGDEKQPMATIKAFMTPFTALLQPISFANQSIIVKSVSLLFFVAIGFSIWLRRFKLTFVSVVLLTLANIRYVDPSQDYYRGFHLLIWYALIIFSSCYLLYALAAEVKTKRLKQIIYLLPLVVLVIALISANPLFVKRDINHDYYVNFSRQYTFGEAIRIMKSPNDTLFVIPDEWLLYWQGDIKNANKMVNYYPWMERVPELTEYVKNSFQNNPPTFFYCDCHAEKVYEFSSFYTQMKKDGNETSLWVLESKLNQLSEQQKNELRFHNFEI